MLHRIRTLLLVPLVLLGTGPNAKAETQIRLEVRYGPATIARITIAGRETDNSYSIAGHLVSSGVVGAFRPARFRADSAGRLPGWRPARYSAEFDTGERAGAMVLEWQGNSPRVLRIEPDPSEHAIAPDTASGSFDLLAALWRVVRGGTSAELCNFDMPLFDGARLSRLELDAPRQDGDTLRCTGRYARVAGYSPDEIARAQAFPFTATYSEVDGRWRLTEVTGESLLGRIRIVPQD